VGLVYKLAVFPPKVGYCAETIQIKGSAMKPCTLWITLLMVAALLLPAGFAFSQGRMAQIEDAKGLLDSNPTVNNRLRLGTLQYLQGVDYLKAGDLNNAIDSMQAGVWTLEDGKGQVPENHPVFEEARYGLAYTLLHNNNPYEALLVLDQTVSADPDFGKARYLLGVTLMNIPGEKSMKRGIDVMAKLAQDGRDPYKEWAAHSATRFAYNLSTLPHATGNAAGASAILDSAIDAVGAGNGSSANENTSVEFARGIYLRDTGDVLGALEHLEAAHSADAGYRLSNGVALSGVLANMYYASGLEQLQAGGDSASSLAADLFGNALKVGDSGALDARHGKAVAHTRLGQTSEAVEELKAIVAKDPGYYERIKAK
jgi:tetratricopeptide (TPR) repeat protein